MIVRIAAWPCAHRQKASVARQKKEGGGRRRTRGGGGAGEGSGDAAVLSHRLADDGGLRRGSQPKECRHPPFFVRVEQGLEGVTMKQGQQSHDAARVAHERRAQVREAGDERFDKAL